MATVNTLKKMFENTEKFESLDSHALATHSGFLKAEEQIQREKVDALLATTEYLFKAAHYRAFAEASKDLVEASAEFATLSYLNREYEIRYNKVYHETYGIYPNSTPAYGWKEEVEA